jgi:hypothetical protein
MTTQELNIGNRTPGVNLSPGVKGGSKIALYLACGSIEKGGFILSRLGRYLA